MQTQRTYSRLWTNLAAVLSGAALIAGTTGCGDQADDGNEPQSAAEVEPVQSDQGSASTVKQAHSPAFNVPELTPQIGANCLQIDRAPGGDNVPDDADLYEIADPADGTGPYNQPSDCSFSDWLDWESIDEEFGSDFDASEFRLSDAVSAKGTKDPTAFPFSDNRVGLANVLGKQDLVEGTLANNSEYVYFGLSRQGTNGSSSYFWIFTQVPPHIHGAENRLTYDVTEGDILFVGDFDPSATDLLQVYQAKPGSATDPNDDSDNIPAQDMATPENTDIWQSATGSVLGALNTTITEPGTTFHTAAGIPSNQLTKGGDFAPGAFAEGAVDLNLFTGGATCGGGVFHGTVITRPSRSRNSDLKDLISPFVLNLGNISATASVSGGCDSKLDFSMSSVTGPLGNSLVLSSLSCDWVVKDSNGVTVYDPASAGCDATYSFDITSDGTAPDAADTYTASVSISGSGDFSSCSATASDSAFVANPLSVGISAENDKMCVSGSLTNSTTTGDSVKYTSTVSEGDGSSANDTYCWTVGSVSVWSDCDGSSTEPAACGQLTGCGTSDSTCEFDFADDAFCADTTIQLTVDDDTKDSSGTADSSPCTDTTADFCADDTSDQYKSTKKTTIDSVNLDASP
jgi:hypothetical protein